MTGLSRAAYTHIVVGAGSAGCVLAARLSEDPSTRVLLLEAGGPDDRLLMRMPAAFYELLKVRALDWQYESESEPGAGGRRFPLQRGKVVGGTGTVNGMTYSRGDPRDYDDWARSGARGWSHADVLPYFRRSESHWRGSTPHHGGTGPVAITRSDTSRDPFAAALMAAAKSLGCDFNDDICGERCEGFAPVEFAIQRGRRASTARQYLAPAMGRAQLRIESQATVTRVLLDGTRATGVEYLQHGQLKRVYCDGEVVLSAGAYNSPQVLMLSGIGAADELRAAGVEVHHDLPAVGRNLTDHVALPMAYRASRPVTFHRELRLDRLLVSALRWQLFGSGPLAQLPVSCWAFRKTDPALERADVQFFFSPVSMLARPWFPGLREGAGHIVTARNALRYPHSRGSVRLRSADPLAKPIIRFNLLSDDRDLQSLVRAVRQTRELMATAPVSDLIECELPPSAGQVSDADLAQFVRENARPACHPSCTCPMGEGPTAVVDAELRVRGLDNLRVADASVMPSIVGGNINTPTIMIAERAAELLLQASARATAPPLARAQV